MTAPADPFDRALSALRAKGVEGAQPDIERARAELKARVERVERLRRSPGWAHRLTLRALPFFAPSLVVDTGALVGIFVTWLLVGSLLYSTGLIALLPPLLVLLFVIAWIQWLHARSVIGRWDGRLCPSCAYDVSTLPDLIPGAATDGRRVGPELCPECGRRWPLVPVAR